MAPSVAVVIPAGGSDPYRLSALRHIQEFYRCEFPDWPVVTAHDPLELERGIFSRARAVNDGAARTVSTILIVNDADTLCPPEHVLEAVRLADAAPGLVRAYSRYRRLSREASERLGSYRDALSADDADIYWQQEPAFAHGCAVTRRACFDTVGGYDPKFEGWGYEDMAAELIFDAFWPPDRRITGDLIHLFHESAETPEDAARNRDLYYRLYEPLRGCPELLLKVRQAEE